MATRSSPRRPKGLAFRAAVVTTACLMLGGCSRWIGGADLPMDGARTVQPQLSDAELKAWLKKVDNDSSIPPAGKAGL